MASSRAMTPSPKSNSQDRPRVGSAKRTYENRQALANLTNNNTARCQGSRKKTRAEAVPLCPSECVESGRATHQDGVVQRDDRTGFAAPNNFCDGPAMIPAHVARPDGHTARYSGPSSGVVRSDTSASHLPATLAPGSFHVPREAAKCQAAEGVSAGGYPSYYTMPSVRQPHDAESALLSTEGSLGMTVTDDNDAKLGMFPVFPSQGSLCSGQSTLPKPCDSTHQPRSWEGRGPYDVMSGLRDSSGVSGEAAIAPVSNLMRTAAQADADAMDSLKRKAERVLCISRPGGERPAAQGGVDLASERDGDSATTSVDSGGDRWNPSFGYTDIDCNFSDPQMCATYAKEIYKSLREAEVRNRPGTDFMERVQSEINPSMRGILIDWLVEVATEYKLVSDTLYLTCSYIDRFLSSKPVSTGRLQLLGVSCMLIAAKYEEIYAPQVDEFCYITDNTYRRDEVLEMERQVLGVLQFDLSTPTTKSFLRRFLKAAQAGLPAASPELENLGNYLIELTLVDYASLRFLPSQIAAASVFLAKYSLYPGIHPWDSTLQHYTGYSPSDLRVVVMALHDLHCNMRNCTLPAIREKYGQPKFGGIALMPQPSHLPEVLFEDLK